MRGADLVLLVTEPTPFGLHDLCLAVQVARDELGLPVGLVINRASVGDAGVDTYCTAENIPILMRIPLDRRIAEAISNSQALAHLASEEMPIVLADADVDAASLELVLDPARWEEHVFMGGQVAVIDPQLCQLCGRCYEVCRFDAVIFDTSIPGKETCRVDPLACEGCASCIYRCPENAIHSEEQQAGLWFRSDTRLGPLFHAHLFAGQENSGKLVTEPTVSGVHDLESILRTVNHFRVPALVPINKADVNLVHTAAIETYYQTQGIALVGKLTFDTVVTEAMVQGQPVSAYQPDGQLAMALHEVWAQVRQRLNGAGYNKEVG